MVWRIRREASLYRELDGIPNTAMTHQPAPWCPREREGRIGAVGDEEGGDVGVSTVGSAEERGLESGRLDGRGRGRWRGGQATPTECSGEGRESLTVYFRLCSYRR